MKRVNDTTFQKFLPLLFIFLVFLIISTLLRNQIRGQDQILLMQAPIQEADLAPQPGIEQWWEDLDDFLANRRTNGVQQNDSTWWSFTSFAARSVRNLSPTQHGFFLMLLVGILSVLTRTCASLFESFQVGKSTYTHEAAFYALFPEVAHITDFIICWIITLILILPRQHVLHIFFGLLCSATVYFGKLKEKASASASEINEACNDSFKLSLFWFTMIHAVGVSVIIGLMLFLIAYLSWKFMHKGNLRDALSLRIFVGKLLLFWNVFDLVMWRQSDSASRFFVACGGLFKVPMFWLAIFVVVGCFVIIGLVEWLIAY